MRLESRRFLNSVEFGDFLSGSLGFSCGLSTDRFFIFVFQMVFGTRNEIGNSTSLRGKFLCTHQLT